MAFKDIEVLVLETVNITLHVKRDVADVIELRIFRREIVLYYLSEPYIKGRQKDI